VKVIRVTRRNTEWWVDRLIAVDGGRMAVVPGGEPSAHRTGATGD
jgi:hypothetical protein